MGRWHSATDAGELFVDATTGAPIGALSSTGIDFAALVAFGRDVGGPALRALTFHQRATILRSLGKLLLADASRDQLYPLSAKTGATRTDSWIDIEGGASVLLSYASRARRELPNAHVAVDGQVENLSRDGSFVGIHVLTPREGVEVQINAFNFPIWGMLEKLAPAFLAAVPTIVKPAPETAFLAEAAVRIMVDSELLPEGSLQLICGDPGDLLHHLGGQDSVAFTGSATTASHLRTHPAIAERSVRFAVEADSINAAILAPSSGPDTPEFDLFVRRGRQGDDGEGGAEVHGNPARLRSVPTPRCHRGSAPPGPREDRRRRPGDGRHGTAGQHGAARRCGTIVAHPRIGHRADR